MTSLEPLKVTLAADPLAPGWIWEQVRLLNEEERKDYEASVVQVWVLITCCGVVSSPHPTLTTQAKNAEIAAQITGRKAEQDAAKEKVRC